MVGPLDKGVGPTDLDLKFKLRNVTRTYAETRISSIVSTRVYNKDPNHKDFLKPQITSVARGGSGMKENNFGARFPGGIIPYDEIMKFTRNAARQSLPPPPDGTDPAYTELYNAVMGSSKGELATLAGNMNKRLEQEKNKAAPPPPSDEPMED